MGKRKSSQPKKPRGKLRLLTLPPELDDWLVQHTKKRGASTVQEAVRQILIATRTSEQGQQTATR